MKVKELIEVLKKLPPEAHATFFWDMEARSIIEYAWESRDGKVVLSEDPPGRGEFLLGFMKTEDAPLEKFLTWDHKYKDVMSIDVTKKKGN